MNFRTPHPPRRRTRPLADDTSPPAGPPVSATSSPRSTRGGTRPGRSPGNAPIGLPTTPTACPRAPHSGPRACHSEWPQPVTLEAIDPALDRVALAVVARVEMWRPATAGAGFPAVTYMVGLVWDAAADSAAAQVGAVLAGGVRLVSPHSLGADAWPARPDAGHTDLLSKTGSNCSESPRCPAVTTIDTGFWPCSTAKCSLVVNSPRERPSP